MWVTAQTPHIYDGSGQKMLTRIRLLVIFPITITYFYSCFLSSFVFVIYSGWQKECLQRMEDISGKRINYFQCCWTKTETFNIMMMMMTYTIIHYLVKKTLNHLQYILQLLHYDITTGYNMWEWSNRVFKKEKKTTTNKLKLIIKNDWKEVKNQTHDGFYVTGWGKESLCPCVSVSEELWCNEPGEKAICHHVAAPCATYRSAHISTAPRDTLQSFVLLHTDFWGMWQKNKNVASCTCKFSAL